MAGWNIRTYTAPRGRKPVEEWIESLDPRDAAAVVRGVELLERHGTDLGLPFARHLRDGIWELRVETGGKAFRLLYFHWKGRTFGLLHGFTKKRKTTPRDALSLATSRRAEWLERARKRQA